MEINHSENIGNSSENRLKYLLVMILAIMIAYFNALGADFSALDDIGVINYVKSYNGMMYDLIFANGTDRYYRPLILASFVLDYKTYAFNAAGFHMTNILMHLLNTILLYFLSVELFKNVKRKEDIALLACLIFALHPINTEAVVWISGRSDLLSCVFFLSSALLLIKKRDDASFFAVVFLFLTYLCALLAKESAIMLFPLALIYFFLERNRIARKNAALPLISLTAATLTYFVLRNGWHFAADKGLGKAVTGTGAIQDIFVNDLAAYGFYIGKMLYPFPLRIAITDISTGTNLIAFFVTLSILAYLWDKHKWIRFPVLIVLTGLLPPIFALNGSLPWTPYAERYTYMPLTGFALIAGFVLVNYVRKVPLILLMAGVLFLAVPTMYRVAEWSEPVTFWRNAVAGAPNFSSLRLLLAAELLNEGKYPDAVEQLHTAHSLGFRREEEKRTYNELTAVAKRAEKKNIFTVGHLNKS
jgi:hypothetical protein